MTRHIFMRVMTALILAAIFGLLAKVSRAADSGSYTGYSGIVVSWAAERRAAPHNDVIVKFHATATIIVSVTTNASAYGYGNVSGAMQGGTGSQQFYFIVPNTALPHTFSWTTQNSAGAYFTPARVETISGSADPRRITLSVTAPGVPANGPQYARMYGWGKVGDSSFQEPVWLTPQASKTWYITLPATDTNTYVVKLINTQLATANGTLNAIWGKNADGTDKVPGVDPPDYYDAGPGGVAPVGTPKGYADGETPPAPGVGVPIAATPLSPTTPGVQTGTASAAPLSAGGDGGGAAGQISGFSVNPSNPNGSVTQASDAANTNSLLNKLNELNETMKAVKGGVIGGGGTDMTGVESRLDTANTHLDKMGKVLTGTHEGQTAYANATQISSAQAAAGAIAEYSGKKPTGQNPSVNSALGTTVTSWGSAFHIGSTNLQFGLGSSFAGSHSLMVAGRSVLLAAACLGFLRLCSGTLTTYTAALPQVQAQETNVGPENLVPGVSQAKTWGTAATAVLTIFGGAAALVAVADTMVTYFGGGILTIFNALSFPGGMAAAAIDQYVPLAPMIALTILGSAVPYAMAPVYLAASAVLRFLKT